MRRADIVTNLARRHVPLDASPEARAAIYRECEAAVRAAGRNAEAALLLIALEDGDQLTAFTRQAEALAATSGRRASPRDGGDDED